MAVGVAVAAAAGGIASAGPAQAQAAAPDPVQRYAPLVFLHPDDNDLVLALVLQRHRLEEVP